jgi:hypothetical protein
MVQEGTVLGHKTSGRGIEVDKSKVEGIEKIPPPRDIKGIRRFLGHAGIYRRFIRNFSRIARPLTNLLQKYVRLKFDENCLNAFITLKRALLNALMIKPPDWSKPLELLCEANHESIGVGLCQRDGNELNIIHHASRTLNNAQINYPLIEKELFTVVFVCEKFRFYITDSKVRAYTDRLGLKEILEWTDVKPRMIRWTLLLQELDLQIIQRSEEQLEDRESVDKEILPHNISTVFIPPGTLCFCEDVSAILLDGVSKHLLPTICRGKGGTI